MKRRAIIFWQEHANLTKGCLLFLFFGFCYFLIVAFTPLRLPCPFHLVTGLHCPGCGISRFFLELLHFHPVSALRQNLAVGVLLSLWTVVFFVEFFFNPRALDRGRKLPDLLIWLSVIFLVLFGIVRNLPGMEWLLPTL